MPGWADGPHIAFHGTDGPYTVTVFSAPDPLVAGPVELSLLVQAAPDGPPIVDPQVQGQLALPGHQPIALSFAGGVGSSRLLVANVKLTEPGQYRLILAVVGPAGAAARFQEVLEAAPNHGKRNTVLWAVVLPSGLILLFLANQYGKARLRENKNRASR